MAGVGRQLLQGRADKFAALGASGELHPDAAGLMVPPGHVGHIQSALVTERQGSVVNVAVVHETGIAE